MRLIFSFISWTLVLESASYYMLILQLRTLFRESAFLLLDSDVVSVSAGILFHLDSFLS